MSDETENDVPAREQAPERASRTERHGENAGAQPSEYADDMLVNRFTPPPPPGADPEKD